MIGVLHRAIPALYLCPWLAAACGSSEPPPVLAHDLASLHPGVDAHAEAAAVARGLESAGFVLGARLEGEGFVALDAAHADGRTAVRIVTSRGIAWIASADPTLGEPGVALRSWRDPGDFDLDGDGRPELAVARFSPERGRECIVLARVGEDGAMLAVPVELGRLGEAACIEEIRDISGDGRPELLAARREDALANGSTPVVFVPLAARAGGFSPAPASVFASFWEAEGRRRREELERARAALDLGSAYRLAVELAAIERELGRTTAAQVTAFDAALLGLVLSPEQAAALARARSVIADGWRE